MHWNLVIIALQLNLVISMSGTAAEQAVGLAKPVIQIEGKGPQFTKSFAEAQRRLLGNNVYCVSNFKNKKEQIELTKNLILEIIYLIKSDDKFLIACQKNAKERLGEQGACVKMIEDMNIN